MAEPETKSLLKTSTSIIPDWSLLPEELLHIISEKLMDHCFDVVHARSVCSLWRSIFTFPSSLLRPSYSLPTFTSFPNESDDFCTLEKIHLFLFRHQTSPAYFLGRIGQNDSAIHKLCPSPLQCSVKVENPGSYPTLMKILDYQIIPLGHHYRLIGCKCNPKNYRGVAFHPLDKQGRSGEFVVVTNYKRFLLVLTSAEMRWKKLENVPTTFCRALVTFRGRFYANFLSGETFVVDPYSLEVTLLLPSLQKPVSYLVPSGNDELFVVEVNFLVSDISGGTCRVLRLDEEAGKWIEVRDLGDRVLFIGKLGNVSCSAEDLPHGCGLSGNSILFTSLPGNVTFPYKYGVHTGNAEDDLNCWRPSRENRVSILNKS